MARKKKVELDNEQEEQVIDQAPEQGPELDNEQIIAKAIGEAKTLVDLKKCEDMAIQAFGSEIPQSLNSLAEEKHNQIVKESMKPKTVETGGWIPMTDKEKDEAERKGLLVGWNNKKKRGLLKKG